ncbi:MAG: KH domain-containing protein [Chloroflexi bacterium]|nr:KH domain-containing protein [Chloroflexota bacterium]MCH8901772.1 KH domain-containing protein [Chloroflexota bacterium]
MKELVEFLARSIVEDPDAVEVEVEEGQDGDWVVYHLYVADNDMGKVIGKQGRIANAMRTLLKIAATRRGIRVSLDIGD